MTPLCARRRGFTLTEILVVISIIGILASLTYTLVSVGFNSARRYEAMAETAKRTLEAEHTAPHRQNVPPIIVTPTAPPLIVKVDRSKFVARPAVDAPAVPQEYIVEFPSSVTDVRAEANRLATQYDGKVLSTFSKLKKSAALRIPDQNYDAFRADNVVAGVTKNYLVAKRQQTKSTGYRRIFSYPTVPTNQLVLLRPTTLTSPNRNIFLPTSTLGAPPINIAIMDGGVDRHHPDLNVVYNYSFGGIPIPDDQDGHGTHVAGIAAARDNNRGVVGVYPGAPIWNLRVLDATGNGTLLGVLEGLYFVYLNADKIKVCNLSFGPPVVVPIMDFFVDGCALNGVVMVGAAGNDGKPASSSSPGSSNFIVNVAALADSDGRPGGLGKATVDGPDDTYALFSDWDYKVTVIAPGVNILSTYLGGGYAYDTGTSMSAPFVAGTVALLLDPNTTFGKNERNLILRRRPPIARDMPQYMRSIATEQIPGILGDTLKYPLVNFKVQ